MQVIVTNYKIINTSYQSVKDNKKSNIFFHLKLNLTTALFTRVSLKILSSIKKVKSFYVSQIFWTTMHLFKACISKKEICQNWIALKRSHNVNLNDKSSCLKTYQKPLRMWLLDLLEISKSFLDWPWLYFDN